MNELIEKLAEQCVTRKFYVDHASEEFDYKKFAEVLIQKCFDVVIADGRFHDARGIIRAGKSVAMEHFGVDE